MRLSRALRQLNQEMARKLDRYAGLFLFSPTESYFYANSLSEILPEQEVLLFPGQRADSVGEIS